MPAAFNTTSGIPLRYMLGTDNASDIDEGFQRLAEDCASKLLGYSQDTLAKRPAAGVANRIFRATDTGQIFHDTGSEWEALLGSPKAAPTIGSGSSGTPSATRSTLVNLTIFNAASFYAVNVFCAGKQVGRVAQASGSSCCSFLCGPGEEWHLAEGEGAFTCNFAYRVL